MVVHSPGIFDSCSGLLHFSSLRISGLRMQYRTWRHTHTDVQLQRWYVGRKSCKGKHERAESEVEYQRKEFRLRGDLPRSICCAVRDNKLERLTSLRGRCISACPFGTPRTRYGFLHGSINGVPSLIPRLYGANPTRFPA